MSATSKPWLVAAVLWTVAILAVNSRSVPNAPQTFSGADKLTHAAMYAIAAFGWRSSVRSQSETASWWVVLAIAFLGAVDEWHQLMVPGRSMDVRDWFADLFGALLGVVLWRWLLARKHATV